MATDSSRARQRHQPGEMTTTVTLPPMPSQPRTSRYKILKLHGRGGMGEIWLAEDEHIGRQVAFKRIRTDKEQVLDRFFAEYASLNHFTQTVIRTVERGEIMRWPPRAGTRRLL